MECAPALRRIDNVEQARKYKVYQDNECNRSYYSCRGRTSYFLGAGSRRKAFFTSDGRDDEAKKYTLYETGIDVAREDRVSRRLEI